MNASADYVARRLLYMVPVLFGVALLVFILFNTVGEDPVRVALGRTPRRKRSPTCATSGASIDR